MRAALATALVVLALLVWLWRDRLPDARTPQGERARTLADASNDAGEEPEHTEALPEVAAPPPAQAPAPAAAPRAPAAPVPGAAAEEPTSPAVPALREAAPPRTPPPEVASVHAPADVHRRVHRVQPGDSLWSIAESELGDGNRARELYEANRDQIKDPHRIHPGQVLVLPPGS